MIRALLVSTTESGVQALQISGLAAVLAGMGFSVELADVALPHRHATQAGRPWLAMVWLARDHSGMLSRSDFGMPPESLVFAVTPADAGASVESLARSPAFDATLSAPVNARSVAQALAGHGFVALSPDECAAIGSLLDTLAGGDADIVRDLVDSLIETNRIDLDKMRAALEAGVWQCFGSGAHRLKGSARILECATMVTLCGWLESIAELDDLATAQALLPILAATVEHLEAVLTALRPPSRTR
ncbi:Hpt domain-containing protein [Cupriavidus basilensis]|uniref:Hpt domain-containing protein n=1 Tax=Cupriavidus basilensis TaxID=68895 RepID=A0ABT6ATQ5_9BURK|nr:Hpt domain-containing protein [Cupriavidus basilensis]MDF3836011.1 Hpt domain-containing protein [Cupriavidus basilensis]